MDQKTNGSRAVLIYDGHCGFCRRWVDSWKRKTGSEIDYRTSQEVSSQYPQIPAADFQSSVQLVEPDGAHYGGAHAVFRVLAHAPRGGGWLWSYRNIPFFAGLSEAGYRLAASHRLWFSRLMPGTRREASPERSYTRSRSYFLRGLGLIYAAAFISLDLQLDGLIGERGILPAREWLGAVAAHLGPDRFWRLPTLAWLASGDAALHLMARLGAVSGVCLALGVFPFLAAILGWFLYLSFVSISRDFLGFQWDVLLLETGFLALFLGVPSFWKEPETRAAPSRGILFLFHWLLFRLMFSSGFVKLASGDPAWRSLEALSYHYQTQPLPAWTSWYVHQLPPWFDRFCVAVMFGIELVLPFAILGPRTFRLWAAAGLVFLQVVIMATGNYCFFNLLTILLCLMLVDDAFWSGKKSPHSSEPLCVFQDSRNPVPRMRSWPRPVTWTATGLLFLLSLPPFLATLKIRPAWPAFVRALEQQTEGWNLTNHYGLFAVMTTTRPEIIVEGSDDGIVWKAYEFPYKPGDLSRSPGFVAPYQPRLDWQMWFAALGSARQNPWFLNFCVRLLQGEPAVLKLMRNNPFPSRAPRFLRAMVYEYRFTSPEVRRQTGHYWEAGPGQVYLPPISLRGPR